MSGGGRGVRSGGIFRCPQRGLLQTAVLMSLRSPDCKSQVAVVYRFTHLLSLFLYRSGAVTVWPEQNLLKLVLEISESSLSMSPSAALTGEKRYIDGGCVRQLVTCLWSCARLALCLEVVDGSWLLWFTGNSTCALCAFTMGWLMGSRRRACSVSISAPFSLELFCLTPLLTVCFDGDSGLFLWLCVFLTLFPVLFQRGKGQFPHLVFSHRFLSCDW